MTLHSTCVYQIISVDSSGEGKVPNVNENRNEHPQKWQCEKKILNDQKEHQSDTRRFTEHIRFIPSTSSTDVQTVEV